MRAVRSLLEGFQGIELRRVVLKENVRLVKNVSKYLIELRAVRSLLEEFEVSD